MKYLHHNGQRRKIDRLVKHFTAHYDDASSSAYLYPIVEKVHALLLSFPDDDVIWKVENDLWNKANEVSEDEERRWLISQTY